MRATRNWGLIRWGETFEAMATTIIFFEDGCARLFGRRGHDGGQDAQSGDGKTIYQAKHHTNPTAAKAIADAKREADNIARYKRTGNPRQSQWTGVTDWILVTNASFNPTDEQTWKTDIVPLFSALELTAKYWEEATLDGYLDKHPEIDRAFFQNENRIFLSPPEACLRVADDDPFSRREELGPYVGRGSDFAALDAFLTSHKSYVLVHAAGGIGKTRFLLEGACEIAAKGEWQVLWANVHSMEASSTWFDAVVPERQTLLIIDEPDDERLVGRLREQLGRRVGRAQNWKIAIAVRSAKDPILRALQHPRIKQSVGELLLKPLETQECEEMCLKLLETGKLADTDQTWRQKTAKVLARRFDGYPIWLTLAVHLLEEDGSLAQLPETAGDLCRLYLGEALKGEQEKENLLQLIRWVALLGPINREDEGQLQHLADRAGFGGLPQVRQALQQWVSARLLRRWGARDRLVDVKPDVLRDFILRDWFCEERDYGATRYVPSESAQTLISELTQCLIAGTAQEREKRVLAAVARTDFLLRFGNIPAQLGVPLFATLGSALSSVPPSQRISLVEQLGDVGAYYPGETLQLLRRFRLEPAIEETVEGYLGSLTRSQNDVLLELAHAVHQTARGLLTDEQRALVLGELYALVIEEQRIGPTLRYGLPNDGKRADGVIRSLLDNGPSYSCEFGDAAAQVVLREMGDPSAEHLGNDKLRAVHVIVKCLCNVLRHQSWSEGSAIHMHTQLLHPKHSNMVGRAKVLTRIRTILEREFEVVDHEARAALWEMLSEAHRQANYAKGHLVDKHDQTLAQLNNWLLEDLMWAKDLLTRRSASPQELRSARGMWHWHAEYGSDEFNLLAKELENVYLSHPTVQLFESLTDWDERGETQRRIELKAKELAVGAAEEIRRFLAEGQEFFGDRDIQRLFSVANALGQLATEYQPVQDFLTEGIRIFATKSSSYEFVMNGVSSWVFSQRRQNAPATAKLVGELLNHCSSEKKLDLLRTLYGGHFCYDDALLNSAPECDLVRRQKPTFVEANAVREFIACTLWGMRYDWAGLKTDIEDVLNRASREQRAAAMRVLIERVHQVVDKRGDWKPSADLLQWLWRQLVATPSLDGVQHDKRWYIEQLLKVLGKAPTAWLLDAVRLRAALQEERGGLGLDPPSKLLPMVELIGPENANAPDVQDTTDALVALLLESAMMKYWIPELLARVDPQGLEVPRRVAAAIEAMAAPKDVQRLSKVGCYYKVGTPAWRQITRAAFKASQYFATEETEHVFYAVSETGHRSWTTEAGKVAKTFTDAVEDTQRSLATETEPNFLPFWHWRLQRVEAELRRQQEDLLEEVWD